MKNMSVPVKAIKINPGFNPKACSLDTLDSIQSIFTEFQQEIELVCINCQKWLRNQTKIITQSDFYCVGCFAALLPTCQYYQVIRHDSFDIFGGGWPAKHQLFMLTAFQRFGFGNLKAVQEYMGYLGANYFMDQIQYHYNKFYRNQVQKLQENCSIVDLTKISNPSRKHRSRNCRGGKSIQKSTWASMYRMYHQNEQEIPCYNSKRQQFSIEYNQNLEKYICDLEFRENDSQKEMEIKFQILEAYNAGLEDRIEKHNFIIEHKLLDQNYQAQEARYLELNSYAYKANQILIQLMRTMTRDEYVQLRKQLEFCLRIQALIESIRSVKASNSACSLKSLSRLDRKKQKQDEELGKPRKRVHRNPEDEEQEQQKAILKKLNVGKEELRVMINRAHQQSQTVIFKGVKITPIKN